MQRLISALIGAFIIVAAVWYAGIPLLILTGAIVALGIREVVRILEKLDIKPSMILAQAGGLILLAGAYFFVDGYPGPTITIILFLHFIFCLVNYPKYNLADMASTLFVTLYIGLLYYFYLISTLESAWIWLILMLTCTWACDIFAFIIGKSYGRFYIVPVLSPKKTVEGTIAGIIGSTLVAGVFTFIYPDLPLVKIIVLGLLIGVAAFLGDILASAIKRQAGIKDSGTLIPGHGGILDRFDSVFFTAPLVYYYAMILLISK
ncbi:MAG: phosphatidate cytidylyltransferase [Peptococcaceae bacterium]|nr:phosphatidate cytidylyltransferase [Peptococcaceae bacterium]